MPTKFSGQHTDMLLVAHFSADHHTANDRFTDLAARFQSAGVDVELVTSSFSHVRKCQRTWDYGPLTFRRTLVREPGYETNVSPSRLWSHRVMAHNVRRFLRRRPRPDVIYCAVPSLAVGRAVANFAHRHQIPLVIDVQDLWPEAFRIALPRRRWTSAILSPMARVADYIYRSADMIVGVSASYASRAASQSDVSTHVLYLGTNLATFDEHAKPDRQRQHPDEVHIAYVGTLGRSYDLNLVSDAIALAQRHSSKRLRFVVMGDGPHQDEFKRYAERLGIRANFLGRLPYDEMVPFLASCDIAVNPIVPGAAASVINKVADYAAAALPVLNTQDHAEYRSLITAYEAGVNCRPGDRNDLAEQLVKLVEDPGLRRRLGQGNRKMASELFDRSKTYDRFVDNVCDFINRG